MAEKTFKYDNYCLAFLDVLGQKDSFMVDGHYVDTLLYKETLSQEQFVEKLKVAHDETASKVEKLRGLLEDFHRQFRESAEKSKAPSGISEEEYSKYKAFNLECWTISDSILIATQISDLGEMDKALLTNIYRIFISCELVMSMSLWMKKVIRGSIEVGMGTKLRDNTIYGPVACRAYHLESDVAQYPRIVIGDELVNFLHGQLSNPDKYAKSMAELCMQRIKQDYDGVLIHDYAGVKPREELVRIGYTLEDFYGPAIEFARTEHLKFQRMRDQKLADRYYKLYRYLLASNE